MVKKRRRPTGKGQLGRRISPTGKGQPGRRIDLVNGDEIPCPKEAEAGEHPIHGTLGIQYVVECSGCLPDVIGSVERVQAILLEAAARAGAQVWGVSVHRFPPNGVSGVVVISESHLSVHTWPEMGYAALDIYTCGNHTSPMDAVMYVLAEFGAGTAHITEIERGLDDNDRIYYHSITTWEE